MSQNYLCIGTAGLPLYEGDTFPSQNSSDIVLDVIAYQLDLRRATTSIENPSLRVTVENPARLPALLPALTEQSVSFRLVVREIIGDTGVILNEFRGSGLLAELIPHRPNQNSPVNSGFTDMTDIALNLTGTLIIKENYSGEDDSQSSYDFSNAGGS